jgi:hypothetical protein
VWEQKNFVTKLKLFTFPQNYLYKNKSNRILFDKEGFSSKIKIAELTKKLDEGNLQKTRVSGI